MTKALKYQNVKFTKKGCKDLRESGWFVDTENIKNAEDINVYEDYRAIQRKHHSMQCLSKAEKQKIVKEAKKRGIDKEYERREDAKPKNILRF